MSRDSRVGEGSLPVFTPSTPADRSGTHTIWGVVLAAGMSSRFGDRNKLVQKIDGEPMVRRATETLLAAELTDIVVVVGHDATDVRASLADTNVHISENDAYERGQSTSVANGAGYAAERGADAVLILPGDMPYVSSESVRALIAAYQDKAGSALAAACDGQRGNPVLFDSRHFSALTSIGGDKGGRRILLDSKDGALVETGDPGVLRDIDSPEDLRADDVTEDL